MSSLSFVHFSTFFKINNATITYKKPHIHVSSLPTFNNNNFYPRSHSKVKTKAFSSSAEAELTPDQSFSSHIITSYDDKDNVNIMLEISKFILGTLFVPFIGYSLLAFLSYCTKSRNQVKRLSSSGGQLENVSGPDVIIVGAGVAGSALAYALAKDGRQVHVIERDLRQPERIVGELLQPGGYLKLVELGLQDCLEDIDAQRVVGYVMYKNQKTVKLPYPLKKFHLDVVGRSFHNGRFIQRMREKAATLPNVRLNQGTVTSLVEENGVVKGVQYKTKSGEELRAYAPLTIVCDGCFSNLRRSLCRTKVEVPSSFVGLILRNCTLPFANHGHVIIADPSLMLFYPISSTEIRCFVDISGKKSPIAKGEIANYLRTSVAQEVPRELRDAFISAVDEGNIRTMPNRVMPPDPKLTPGVLLLGDALNMRHPLTGGGMIVALSDVVVLRDLLRKVQDIKNLSSLCSCIQSFYILRKPMASVVNIVAGVTYGVLSSSPDGTHQEMQQLCFDYLSHMGTSSSGPVSLLSGLDTQPLDLILKSFALALYAVFHVLVPCPSPERLVLGARLIAHVSAIAFPIIQAEGVKQMLFQDSIPNLT